MKDTRKLHEKVSTFALQMAFSPERLGPNVKLARENLRITQEQAAQRAGVATRTYVAWEHGDSMPRGYNLERLAKALKVEEMDLLSGVNDNEDLPLSEQLDALRADVAEMNEKLDAVLSIFTDSEQLAAAIDRQRASGGSKPAGSRPRLPMVRPPAKRAAQKRSA